MRKLRKLIRFKPFHSVLIVCFVLSGYSGFAADTCMFMTTSDDVTPLIVYLLDNSAVMEHIVFHSGYDNNSDYTPNVAVADQCDVVGSTAGSAPASSNRTLILNPYDETDYLFEEGADIENTSQTGTANVLTKVYDSGKLNLTLDEATITGDFSAGDSVQRYRNKNNIATGTIESIDVPAAPATTAPACPNGFYNEDGYTLDKQGSTWSLVKIGTDLLPDTSVTYAATGSFTSTVNGVSIEYATFTINAKTISLPADPSAAIDDDGVKDNATQFRYSMNYLNWLFFAEDGTGSALYTGDGSDLPTVSRFYYAKQALMTVGKMAANRASFGIFNFVSTTQGASQVQPLGFVASTPLASDPADNTLDSNYVNNINNMGTVDYAPLAEGLASIGGKFNSTSSGVEADPVYAYCQKLFVIVVSPGVSSKDQDGGLSQTLPTTLEDFDGDDDTGEIGEGNIKADTSTFAITTNLEGSTWLDDVAYYMDNNDMVGYVDGVQTVSTYTVGFMGDRTSNLFLINTSNNGNGNPNLYDTNDPDYGKYHFTAESPDALADSIMDAVNDILSQNSTFTAPVVPVTRTTSVNRIYMALFKPKEGTFWQGNVVKFGISDDQEIVDANGNAATYPNGAIKEDAVPYWSTLEWASADYSNYMDNRVGLSDSRNIYTYLGTTKDLTDADNRFWSGNSLLTMAVLGNPTAGRVDTINYARGADISDEDGDGNTEENRSVISGDVLHSEPVVFRYNYADNTAKTVVYFGANDGMIHAVLDATYDTSDNETNYGTELWGFVPPQHLHRLKNFLEGTTHIDFIDSSPKIYFKDVDQDTILDVADGDQIVLVIGERKGGTSYTALDITDPEAPQFLWRISQSDDAETGILEFYSGTEFRLGGGSFQDNDQLRIWSGTWGDTAALVDGVESTTPEGNLAIAYKDQTLSFSADTSVGNLTQAEYETWLNSGWTTGTPGLWAYVESVGTTTPDVIIPELGETWCEPTFGLVKTSDADTTGTPVFFIGGGYSSTNATGNAVLAINALTGAVVKTFKNDGSSITDMDYSIVSQVRTLDEDNNGFVDKVYVGDLGGQLWRIGQFSTDAAGDTLSFPESNENINSWTAQVLLQSDSTFTRKFYYPPSVTLEKGYNLVLIGTGDRENACSYPGDGTDTRDPADTNSSERIYVVKDYHSSDTWTESDLVDVTDETDPVPDLDNDTGDADGNGDPDQGWFIRLVDDTGDAVGEKVLAEGTVFYGTFFITTFTPNDEPCQPGGEGKIYGLAYKTGAAVIDFDEDVDEEPERSMVIGGGIPSKAVTVITDIGEKIFISVGSTNPDEESPTTEAGIVTMDPPSPPINFFYLWWKEL